MNGLYALLPGRPDFDDKLHRLGRLCKRGHDWMGTGQSLRRINGRNCVECDRERCATAARVEYRSQWYEANKESERGKAIERQARRLQDPEQRKIQNERVRLCNARRRATEGRESRLKGVQGLLMPPGRALTIPEARVVRQLVAEGHPVNWATLEPVVAATLEMRKALGTVGRSPTVAQLVEAERRRYLREHPEIRRQAINASRLAAHRFKYMTDESYRLYHRQKSKGRKAKMKGSVAIQATGSQIKARFNQFNNRCAYCGAGGDLHIEHVVPISKGGGHAIGNIVPACHRCNMSKTNHDVETWYRAQPFFSEAKWRKVCRVLGWNRSSPNQLALL